MISFAKGCVNGFILAALGLLTLPVIIKLNKLTYGILSICKQDIK